MAPSIIVTTGDIHRDYEILGPVYFQISNKGFFSNQLRDLSRAYEDEINEMKEKGAMGEGKADWGFLYGEFSVGQGDFEKAFFIAVQELSSLNFASGKE